MLLVKVFNPQDPEDPDFKNGIKEDTMYFSLCKPSPVKY